MATLSWKPYDPAQPRRALGINDEDWASHYHVILSMHNDGLTRKQMLQRLREDHLLQPTMGQLVARLGVWGLKANDRARHPPIADAPPSDQEVKTFLVAAKDEQTLDKSLLIAAEQVGTTIATVTSATKSETILQEASANEEDKPSSTRRTLDQQSVQLEQLDYEERNDILYLGRDMGIPQYWLDPIFSSSIDEFVDGLVLIAETLAIFQDASRAFQIYAFLVKCHQKSATMARSLPSMVQISYRYLSYVHNMFHSQENQYQHRGNYLSGLDDVSKSNYYIDTGHSEQQTFHVNSLSAAMVAIQAIESHDEASSIHSCSDLDDLVQCLKAWLFAVMWLRAEKIVIILRPISRPIEIAVKLLLLILPLWRNQRHDMLRSFVRSCQQCSHDWSNAHTHERSEQKLLTILIWECVQQTHAPRVQVADIFLAMVLFHDERKTPKGTPWPNLMRARRDRKPPLLQHDAIEGWGELVIKLAALARLDCSSAVPLASSKSDLDLAPARNLVQGRYDEKVYGQLQNYCWLRTFGIPPDRGYFPTVRPILAEHPVRGTENDDTLNQWTVGLAAEQNNESAPSQSIASSTGISTVDLEANHTSTRHHKQDMYGETISLVSTSTGHSSIRSFLKTASRLLRARQTRNSMTSLTSSFSGMSLDTSSTWSFGRVTGYGAAVVDSGPSQSNGGAVDGIRGDTSAVE